jgi:hypothetical protein
MILKTNSRPLTVTIHNDGWGLSDEETDTLRWAKRLVLLAPIQETDGTAARVEIHLTVLQAMTLVRSGWLIRRSGSMSTPTAYIYCNAGR